MDSSIDRDCVLVERYLDAACKRVVLDEYLDRREDQDGCKAGEEVYDGYNREIVAAVAVDGREEEVEEVKKKVEYSIVISTGNSPISSAVTHTLTPSHDAPPTGRQDWNRPVRPSIVARYQQKVRQSHEQIQRL